MHRSPEGPFLDIVSHGAEQTRRLGAHLGASAAPGDVILLEGEFGSGKTTFAQGIARGLGIDAHYVNSPTFTLVNEYRSGRNRLYHVDLYRLDDDDQVETIGLDDYLDGSGITMIEWPQKAAHWLPEQRLVVRFNYLSETKRTLRFFAYGDRYHDLMRRFRKDAFGM